jgi:hypothetical protein
MRQASSQHLYRSKCRQYLFWQASSQQLYRSESMCVCLGTALTLCAVSTYGDFFDSATWMLAGPQGINLTSFLSRIRCNTTNLRSTKTHHYTPRHTTTHHYTPRHTTTHHYTPRHTTTHHYTPLHTTTHLQTLVHLGRVNVTLDDI